MFIHDLATDAERKENGGFNKICFKCEPELTTKTLHEERWKLVSSLQLYANTIFYRRFHGALKAPFSDNQLLVVFNP